MSVSPVDLGAFFLDEVGEVWQMVAYSAQPMFCVKRVKDEKDSTWLVVGSEQARRWRRLLVDGGTTVLEDPPDWNPDNFQREIAGKVLDALTRYRMEHNCDPEWLKLRDDIWPPTLQTLWGVRAYLDPEIPANTVRLRGKGDVVEELDI